MKKTYVTPVAEKIKFEYRDQVVAASGTGCHFETTHAFAVDKCCTDSSSEKVRL